MIIPIKSKDETKASSNPPEWAMLELNGELVTASSAVAPTTSQINDENSNALFGPDRIELGSLRFTNEGKPIMIVGTHELKGEVIKLKENFCVIKKRRRADNVDFQVVGIVTKKLLFNQYPKSIMR